MARRSFPTTYRGTRLQMSVTLDPDQVSAIDRLATLKRTSRAAIIRQALDFFVAANNRQTDTSAIDVVSPAQERKVA